MGKDKGRTRDHEDGLPLGPVTVTLERSLGELGVAEPNTLWWLLLLLLLLLLPQVSYTHQCMYAQPRQLTSGARLPDPLGRRIVAPTQLNVHDATLWQPR